ncbi:hypothetical protein F441_14705, partial [Phytophthora nicotianae CJ01A1]
APATEAKIDAETEDHRYGHHGETTATTVTTTN